jgi:hypothetical protein
MATGLVGGIYDLFAGSPTAKEQGQFGGLANYDIGAGEGATTAAETYDENLLTNPTVALAPEISAGQSQVEQQKLQNANFGNRAGGTNASTQAATSAERGNIINLMGETQGQAANTLGSLGVAQTGQGASALGNEADLANQRRQQTVGDINGIATGVGSIAEGLFGLPAGAAPTSGPNAYSGEFQDLTQAATVQPAQLDLSSATPEEEQLYR